MSTLKQVSGTTGRDRAAEQGGEGGSDDLALTQFMTYRLLTLVHHMNRAGQRWHQHHSGLALSEWRLLATLGHFGPQTSVVLGDRMQIDKAVVSRVKTKLIGNGLIVERDDPVDRRSRILELTAEGWAIFERVIPLARERQRAVVDVLEPEELQVFSRALGKLDAYFVDRLKDPGGG